MENRKNRKRINYIKYVGDFETTVYEGQTSTEVWASALVKIGTEDVEILHSIDDTLQYLINLNDNIMVYYHNLKFDGEFWLNYLISKLHINQALYKDEEGHTKWVDADNMRDNTIRYTISDMGQWYEILIKINGHYIAFRDSLKLLPFSVKEIGKAFKTKHQKLDMEYVGYRYAGCEITPEEQEYIANDVLVVKEALEIMFEQGHDKMTIGSCCLAEFKKLLSMDYHSIKWAMPELDKIEIDESYGSTNADEYIRKSYMGGWCYVVRGKENKIFRDGTTADVNSLYPSMMHSMSGNSYPIGPPKFWKGDFPTEIWDKFIDKPYYFVRFRCRFYLKKDKLPFIHIRGDVKYNANENLITSDVRDRKTGKYHRYYRTRFDDTIHEAKVTLTLTCTDWVLFNEHYNVEDLEILDGCYFFDYKGMFDTYIDKYKKIKMESKGALRTLAKLFLNNLYGKMASSKRSDFRVAEDREDGLHYLTYEANDKNIGFIPIGSAITSYARNFTIRAAQANYYGADEPGFIYADTDSIHCDLPPESIKGIKVDDKEFCCWKLETNWDKGIFVRQKTYIEHVVAEDLKPIDKPYLNIKCAGMPERCKRLFKMSVEGIPEDFDESTLNEDAREFIHTKRGIEDFKQGLIVPGKLMPVHIAGGIILCETTYEVR